MSCSRLVNNKYAISLQTTLALVESSTKLRKQRSLSGGWSTSNHPTMVNIYQVTGTLILLQIDI